MTNFNNANNASPTPYQDGEMLIHNQEDYLNHIEEDINPDTTAETDADLYQIPINGGIPIKVAFGENNRRPFTPPFQQILKMQQKES